MIQWTAAKMVDLNITINNGTFNSSIL